MDKKLNILHIITGLGNGGAEGALYRICTYDENNTHTVISLIDEGKYGSMLTRNGIKVHCLGMRPGRVSMGGLLLLWRLMRQINPDVVQTWMYHADLLGGVIAKLQGVKSICWGIRHSTLVPGKSKRTSIWIASLCARLSWWIPTKIVSCAESAVGVHAQMGYDRKKFIVIPNGYDLSLYRPDLKLRKNILSRNVNESLPIIGMVARFDAQKDHQSLIIALGLLKKKELLFNCLLIGTHINNGNDLLLQWINENGLADNIHLLDQQNDIPSIMNSIDIHVLSSSYGEAFPNVLAEAMACGVPCVATNVGDSMFIVSDTGFISPASNAQALSEAIQAALLEKLETPEKWTGRKEACRDRIVKHFSIQSMVDSYQAVWSCK